MYTLLGVAGTATEQKLSILKTRQLVWRISRKSAIILPYRVERSNALHEYNWTNGFASTVTRTPLGALHEKSESSETNAKDHMSFNVPIFTYYTMSNSIPYARRPSTFQSLVPVLRKKTDIDIVLEAQEHAFGFVNTYSTHDAIKGEVVITFERDTHFDDLMITFEGQTLTYVEKIATTAPTTGRTTGRHTFLKLLQPIDPSHLPEDRNAKAGVKYQFPFTFVVPERLLPHICQHPVERPDIKDAHLRLPPSFGDPMLCIDGQSLMDDMAPDMSRISYLVRVKMVKRTHAGKFVDIADKAVRVKIIPARQDDPPIDIPEDSKDYELRREKDVKKGLFKIGKIGRLVAETSQTRPMRLPPPNSKTKAPISIMTSVNLRFDPIGGDHQPPSLGSLVSKLRAETFFGATPYRRYPSRNNVNAWDTMKGFYSDSVELSSRCVSTVTWTRHESGASPEYEVTQSPTNSEDANFERRPSVLSINEFIPEPSSTYTGGPFYTACVLVPISLPQNKEFVPSFHSCIVSRSYVLDLNISYNTPSANVSKSSTLLKVPIQISSEGNPATLVDAEATEAEIEAAATREVDNDFFTAQGLEPPSPEYTERPSFASLGMGGRHASVAAPPAYFSGYRNPTQRSHSVSVRAAC